MEHAVTVISGAATDSGCKYDHNEDHYLILQKMNLFLLADGVGGAQAGEVASKMAVERLASEVQQMASEPGLLPEKVLRNALIKTHFHIQAVSSETPSCSGMATTIVICWLFPEKGVFHVAHVGDSRAYLLRGGVLQLLTEDHTILNQIRLANMLPDDSNLWPARNILSQALGGKSLISPELCVHDLRAADRILLCSDGITDMILEEEILKIIRQDESPQEICRRLVDTANLHGGKDNSTAVLIEVVSLLQTGNGG
jgi:PPM family protein phosphatase